MAEETEVTNAREANANEWQADRRLYLDKDGNVVEHKDPAKLSLLVAEGGFLPLDVAEQHGLVKKVKAKKAAEAEAPEAKHAAKKPTKK